MSWHEDCQDFDSRVEASANDANFNDTVFLLTQDDTDNPTGDKVFVNKATLTFISPVFYALFYGPLSAGKDEPIKIEDGTARGFKQLISFICHPVSFRLQVDNVYEIFDVAYFAHKYQIGSLVSQCRHSLQICDIEGKELSVLEWALSTQHGMDHKTKFPAEHALLVNNCWQKIQKDFEKIFPDGKINDEEFLDENVMLKILGNKKLNADEDFVLIVALNYYTRLIDVITAKREKVNKSHKRLKTDSENLWEDKRLKSDIENLWEDKVDKIKSVINLEKVSPKKFSELIEQIVGKIPDKMIRILTVSISSSWKNQDSFHQLTGNAGTRKGPPSYVLISRSNGTYSQQIKWNIFFNFDVKMDDLMYDDELAGGVELKLKSNQDAILHFEPEFVVSCTHCTVDCCVQDVITFQSQGDFKETFLYSRVKNAATESSDASMKPGYTFYMKANQEATLCYEKKCKRQSCVLHLAKMNQFLFSDNNFQVEILEVNGEPVSDLSYSFLRFLAFTPI